MNDERYLTVAQAAERLQVSRRTIERQIAAGRLPVTRVGRLIRIRESDLASAFAVRPEEPGGRRRPGRGK